MTVLLCDAMLCCALPCDAVRCAADQCGALRAPKEEGRVFSSFRSLASSFVRLLLVPVP